MNEAIMGNSLLSQARLESINRALKRLPPGDTAEIGCQGGGTSLLIATAGRRHWACDTFRGLMDVGEFDGGLKNGDFTIHKHGLADAARQRLTDAGIRVVTGPFPASAPGEMKAATFAFVHIDVDTYESIKACFAFFAARMTPGGAIALDDVVGNGTAGAKKAWREIDKRGLKVVSETECQQIVRFA